MAHVSASARGPRPRKTRAESSQQYQVVRGACHRRMHHRQPLAVLSRRHSRRACLLGIRPPPQACPLSSSDPASAAGVLLVLRKRCPDCELRCARALENAILQVSGTLAWSPTRWWGRPGWSAGAAGLFPGDPRDFATATTCFFIADGDLRPGRTGAYFGIEHWSVALDMIATGGLGSGCFPVASWSPSGSWTPHAGARCRSRRCAHPLWARPGQPGGCRCSRLHGRNNCPENSEKRGGAAATGLKRDPGLAGLRRRRPGAGALRGRVRAGQGDPGAPRPG